MHDPSKVFSSSLALSSAEASTCRREAGDKEKLARGWHNGMAKERRFDYLIIDLSPIPLQ